MTTDVFQTNNFPTRWKSLVSGTTKSIRRDRDHIYVDTTLPEAAKQAGCFSLAEFQKVGEVYSGTSRDQCVCQYRKRNWVTGLMETRTKQYIHEMTVKITGITPTRIEGYSVSPDHSGKYDCENDKYSKPFIFQTFTWIPQ
jgi:hypothetical protein